MGEPIVFYVKCRPQEADAWPIAYKKKIVFLGYPPWRDFEGFKTAKSGFRAALYNIIDEPNCAQRVPNIARGYKAAVTHNANLAAKVSLDSLVLVPRPGQGICHVGNVKGPFEIADAPAWADDYLDLRRKNKLSVDPVGSLLGDVVQCWSIGEWTDISFAEMPRWITYRLLSRNTSGIIEGFPELGLGAYETVGALRRRAHPVLSSHRSPNYVAGRLLELVGPSAFEHLAVHLLQLEGGNSIQWHHIGGSGDGGADGIGVSITGEVLGILQCKWYYSGNLCELARQTLAVVRDRWPNCKVVIAVLLGSRTRPEIIPDGVQIMLLEDIASLVLKHRNRLPLALSLGLVENAN